MPGQVHLFLPGDEHPGGRHLVRAIVKDSTDSYAGRHSRTFLDSDGAVGSDAPRATPRPALADGEWHMVTLTTLPEGGKGYELYVDGTRRGKSRERVFPFSGFLSFFYSKVERRGENSETHFLLLFLSLLLPSNRIPARPDGLLARRRR